MMIRGSKGAVEGFRGLPPALSCELARPGGCSEKSFSEALTRFRAVLLALNTPRGRRATGQLEIAHDLGCSVRALYNWRAAFLDRGFAGLIRASRCDKGKTRKIDARALALIADAVPRMHWYGDIRREWIASSLPCGYGSYRYWAHLIRKRLKVAEFPLPGGQNGSSL
jgi:transposase